MSALDVKRIRADFPILEREDASRGTPGLS